MSMRAVKIAIANAVAHDPAVVILVPVDQVYAVERATIPLLPSIEVIGVSSEPQDDGPMVRHLLSIEITVSHTDEDGADDALNAIVSAVRQRLAAAAQQERPIVGADDEVVPCAALTTRWSVSADAAGSIVRAAAVAVEAGSDDA